MYICLYRLIVPQALAGLVHRTKDPDAAAWRFQWSKTKLVEDHFLEAMGWVKAYEYHAFGSLGTRLLTYLQASGETRAAQYWHHVYSLEYSCNMVLASDYSNYSNSFQSSEYGYSFH